MNKMKRAWQLARIQAKKHGGKAKDYFSKSLKVAWREERVSLLLKDRKHITYKLKIILSARMYIKKLIRYVNTISEVNYITKKIFHRLQCLKLEGANKNVRLPYLGGIP